MPPGFDQDHALPTSTNPAELAATLAQWMKPFEGKDPVSLLAMLMASVKARLAASDLEIVERSRALIDAVDRGDVAAVDAALASGFVQFEGSNAIDRDALLASTAQRTASIAQRTWDSENVVRKDDILVYTGKAHETKRGNARHDGYVYVGWFLLQWVRTGNEWRAQLWTWQRETTARDDWNEVFRHGRGFSPEPNRLLVETIRGNEPGSALDLAMGQGRNALYLASQGWTVTGVDGSDEAVRRACKLAAQRDLTFEAISTNIDNWDFGTDRFDLVTLMYAGHDANWFDKITASLRTGGLLVVEGWAKTTPESTIGFSDGQLTSQFDGYEIVRDEIVEDVPDWVHDKGRLVRFVARKK